MYQVANRNIIRKLAIRSFRANRTRNKIAVCAIILTTILFCSVFTVLVSYNYSTQQQTMRMVGGYAHGGFKRITKEQVKLFRSHPLVKESGCTRMLASLTEAPFQKHYTELRYGEDEAARMFFSYPTTGGMPREEKEIATDTAVLDILGVPHKVGEQVELSYPLGDNIITDVFTLSGFWETDEAMLASQIWFSKEYVEKQLVHYNKELYTDSSIGAWFLDVMFQNSKKIEERLTQIVQDNGYQVENISDEDYVGLGVNWAYTSTHLQTGEQIQNILAAVVILLLITVTGYLIIYNIFQISVTGDIRFYGLLKTIGTTGKQIKRMIRRQAYLLALISIPIGLIIGYIVGNQLTKLMIQGMSQNMKSYQTMNIWIFVSSAGFTLFTILISCYKPGKIAAAVSPIEAVRYVEQTVKRKRKRKKTKKGSKVLQMAKESMMRNKKKTILVVCSLSISVVLLNVTYAFSKGFDMDKFLSKFVLSDFIFGSAGYFQSHFNQAEDSIISDDMIDIIGQKEGVKESGIVTSYCGYAQTKITKEELIKRAEAEWGDDITYIQSIKDAYREYQQDDFVDASVELYGLEEMPMQYLNVVEGVIDKEKMKEKPCIIQLIREDDYGNPDTTRAVYHIGDTITIEYANNYDIDEEGNMTVLESSKEEYEIIATAVLPNTMSLRRYSDRYEYAMTKEQLQLDGGETAQNMIYMVNTDKAYLSQMEEFLKQYTTEIQPDMNFESKKSMSSLFETYKMVFVFVGGALSFVIALIGILNFINAEITSIVSRKRELAMLQSIGMTGKQLKKMLLLEGVFYSIITIIVSTILYLMIGNSLKAIENIMWFYSYRFTILPILCVLPIFLLIGMMVPIVIYKNISKESIVERLREAEC